MAIYQQEMHELAGRSDRRDLFGRPMSLPDTGATTKIYLNGKFYSGPMNGVHRVADRLLDRLDRLAVTEQLPAGWDLRLLSPAAGSWAPSFRRIRTVPQRYGHTQLWEQVVLPIVARDGLLISLANFAPVLHRRKVTMVHDAQFRISPRSYSARRRLGYNLLIPAGARTSRQVLTVSDFSRESLDSFGIAPRSRTTVIHNAGEHILTVPQAAGGCERWGLRPGRFVLLFGSAALYKNIQVVFDAFARHALDGIDLVVIGPGAQQLREGGLAVPERARFTGAIDDSVLRSLYASSLCLAFPSRTEGFGLPPLEAMHCGCPVVAAPAGAVPEVCRDAVLYADPGDPDDWAAQIRSLADQPVLRQTKIVAGLARAGDFGWEKSALALVRAIAATLDPTMPPAT